MERDGGSQDMPPRRGDALRYMAILRAGHDFGLSHQEILAVAGPFRAARPRCEQLADALADLILARTAPV
jgi:hypothetical protein